MKEKKSELDFKFLKKVEIQEGEKRSESIEYFTNNRDEINSLLYLAGVNPCYDEEKHKEDHCGCSSEKEEDENLLYDLKNFREDLVSTFDSNNFENSLDVFKNFKLKLMNKGFSPEASERIILNILCDYIKKKSLIIETKGFFNLIERKELFNEPILRVSVEKSNYPEEKTSKRVEMITLKDGETKNIIKNMLKLAGVERNDVVVENEEKEKEKKVYVLDIEVEKKGQKKDKEENMGGFLRVMAKNKDEIEKIIDLFCDYLQKIRDKGLDNVKFSEIDLDSDSKSKLEESEIVVNKTPYLIKDRRIRAESSLEFLNTRILKQRFTKYGDNPLIYEIHKTTSSKDISS
ncbi:MAG: hypothetical protein QXF12_01495 [Candidatus Aenigmatarchaeota archaeon]